MRRPRRAAQQLVHRHAEPLALDIPQRLVDRRDGRRQDDAAAPEAVAMQPLPVMLDRGWDPGR